MNLLAKTFSFRKKKAPQPARNPNRVLLHAALDLNRPMPDVRRSLITINRISLSDLVHDHNRQNPDNTISISTLSRVLNGDDSNGNELAKQILAGSLDLAVREIFPRTRRLDD